jgi:hypothetical protein
MRNKYTWISVVLLVLAFGGLGFGVGRLAAAPGTLDSPGPLGSTLSYTLEDIYNRLDTGAAGAQRIFTEPSSGPTSGTGHTLNQTMAIAPEVDDTNGATQGDVLAGKTFWELTSGGWGLTTGTRGAAPVPKTGQTTSYATGDDGDLEKGVTWPTPRFTDNGDGTVTDNLTGLIWLKQANCGGTRNWANALTFANSLYDGWTGDGSGGDCGLSDGSSAGDWRLPNVRELQSLIDYGRYYPALPSGHPFTGGQSKLYWSSTTYAPNTSLAWYVYMSDGYVSAYNQTNTLYVWPVRGGQ